MKKIFVIGGAGYVGSKLVSTLLQKDYFVTVFDLMIYGNIRTIFYRDFHLKT